MATMAQQSFSSIIYLLLAFNFVAASSNSNFPDSTGGYTIIVAFPENTQEPGSNGSVSLILIENIKVSFVTKISIFIAGFI